MMTALLIVLALLAVAGAAFALLPLRAKSAARLTLKTEREELQEELNAVLAQINDLERMRAEGELDGSEVERLKALDEARAARLLGRIEALGEQPEPSSQPAPTAASRPWRTAFVSLGVTAVVLGGLSALAVPGLQRLALREGEAELYDQSNQLLTLERQLDAETKSPAGQPKLETLVKYAGLAWELQQWERAATAYSAILRLEPSNVVAVSRYGQLLFFSGANDQALTLLRAAAKFDDAEALMTIGNILFSVKNDPKGALEVWEQYQRVTKGKGEARVAELISAARKRLTTSASDTGAQTFATSCAGCHGANGAGIAGSGPNLQTSQNARSAAFITKQVQNGSPNKQMPAFPNITETELEALVKHVQNLKP
jgi:mono/diheme cytochrome c family protein